MLVDALRLSSFGLFSVLGGWVLVTDFRTQKIRNRVLLWGLGFAAAAYGLALAGTLSATLGLPLLGGSYHTWSFFAALAVHTSLSAGAALALWRLKLWPAGDAKLFALFSLLLPLVEAGLPGFPGWLFLTCLINVFLPPAFWILGRALWWAGGRAAALRDPLRRAAVSARLRARWTDWRADPGALSAGLREQGSALAFGLAFLLVLFAVRDQLPEPLRWLSPLLGVAALFAVSRLKARLQRARGLLLSLVGLGAAGMIAAYGPAAALRVLATCLGVASTIGAATALCHAYLSRRETREIPVEELQAHQVLAPATLDRLRRDIVFLGENFNLTYRDGILPRQLGPLKEWLRRDGAATAVVYHTAPFAPWIVLGFCLTLLLRADVAWLMDPMHLPLPHGPAPGR